MTCYIANDVLHANQVEELYQSMSVLHNFLNQKQNELLKTIGEEYINRKRKIESNIATINNSIKTIQQCILDGKGAIEMNDIPTQLRCYELASVEPWNQNAQEHITNPVVTVPIESLISNIDQEIKVTDTVPINNT